MLFLWGLCRGMVRDGGKFPLPDCGKISPAIETGSLHSLPYGIEAFSAVPRAASTSWQQVAGCFLSC